MEVNKGTREWMEGAEVEEKSRRGHWRGWQVWKWGDSTKGKGRDKRSRALRLHWKESEASTSLPERPAGHLGGRDPGSSEAHVRVPTVVTLTQLSTVRTLPVRYTVLYNWIIVVLKNIQYYLLYSMQAIQLLFALSTEARPNNYSINNAGL